MNKCAVYPNDPTDLMTSFCGTGVNSQDIFTYAAANVGKVWIEPNRNYDVAQGNTDQLALVFNGAFGTAKEVWFTDQTGNNPYMIQAVECDFVGGRPPVIRKPH